MNTQRLSRLQQQLAPRPVGIYRRFHYTMLFLYALFSCLFIIGSAIWVNYRANFQSGLLGFFHVITGVLIGLYISSNVIVAGTTMPPSEWDTLKQQQEYMVFKRGAATMIIIAVIAILFSILNLYNLFYIIVHICPSLCFTQTHFTGDAATPHIIANPAVVEVYLTYQYTPPDEKYAKKNVMILKYNTTGKEIVRKTKHFNPNVAHYDQWFIKNEASIANPKSDAVSDSPPLFCISKNSDALFSFLENEISYTLFRDLEDRRDGQSYRVSDKQEGMKARMDNEDEEDMDLNLFTRKICRSEYAFTIALITFIILWDVLSLFIICYNIWLLRT